MGGVRALSTELGLNIYKSLSRIRSKRVFMSLEFRDQIQSIVVKHYSPNSSRSSSPGYVVVGPRPTIIDIMAKAITTSNLTTSIFNLNALPDTMNAPQTLLRSLRASRQIPRCTRLTNAPPRRPFTSSFFRRKKQPSADDPEFVSILDGPPQLVRVGKRHGPGLLVLGMILK